MKPQIKVGISALLALAFVPSLAIAAPLSRVVTTGIEGFEHMTQNMIFHKAADSAARRGTAQATETAMRNLTQAQKLFGKEIEKGLQSDMSPALKEFLGKESTQVSERELREGSDMLTQYLTSKRLAVVEKAAIKGLEFRILPSTAEIAKSFYKGIPEGVALKKEVDSMIANSMGTGPGKTKAAFRSLADKAAKDNDQATLQMLHRILATRNGDPAQQGLYNEVFKYLEKQGSDALDRDTLLNLLASPKMAESRGGLTKLFKEANADGLTMGKLLEKKAAAEKDPAMKELFAMIKANNCFK